MRLSGAWNNKVSVSCLLVLSYSSGGSHASILEWLAIPSFSGSRFVRTLHYHPSISHGPTWHGSSLHWVIQALSPRQDSDPWRGNRSRRHQENRARIHRRIEQKKILMTQITMRLWALVQGQTFWSVKSSESQEALLTIKLVEVMTFQQSYLKF